MTVSNRRRAAPVSVDGTGSTGAVALLALFVCAGVGAEGAADSGADVAPVESVQVLASYPHAPDAFTQGLLVHEGMLYESTGGYGESSVRLMRLDDGVVLRRADLSRELFGEGLALHGDTLYQLTWQRGVMLVLSRDTFELLDVRRYRGEGWGLASDGEQLVMSNGSAELLWREPDDLRVTRRVTVRDGAGPVERLNELEWLPAQGDEPARVLANVWLTDRIAIIDPATGRVETWLDLAKVDPGPVNRDVDEVLNGIAYDRDTRRVYVTGKRWPRLFSITAPALERWLQPREVN